MLRTVTHFVNYWFRVIWYVRSVIFTILAIVVIGAVAIALVEKLPFGEALYFSFVTGLTIGYGDIVVKTALGRGVALLIGLIGILSTGLVTAVAIEAIRKTYHQN